MNFVGYTVYQSIVFFYGQNPVKMDLWLSTKRREGKPMYIKLPTENLNEDKTFIRLLQEVYSAKAALTDYLNDHMGFVLEAESKKEE